MARVLMKELEFKQSRIDHSVFYHQTNNEHTIVAIVTDDMAMTSKRKVNAEKFKLMIKKFWDITDHGPIKWFLGFEIRQNRKERPISINQQAYIKMMVEKFELTNAYGPKCPIFHPTMPFFIEPDGTHERNPIC